MYILYRCSSLVWYSGISKFIHLQVLYFLYVVVRNIEFKINLAKNVVMHIVFLHLKDNVVYVNSDHLL